MRRRRPAPVTRALHWCVRASLMLSMASSAGAALGQTSDQIWTGGTPTRCSIVSFSRTEVTISVSGTERKVPVNTIRRVVLGGEPADMKTGRERLTEGRYENAVESLAKIDLGSITRPLLKEEAEYYIAFGRGKVALSGVGDKAAAEKGLFDVIKAQPNTYHFFEAAELLGDLAVAQEKYEDAAKYYGPIVNAPWQELQLQGRLLQAKAQVGQNKFDDALANFQSVADTTLDTPDAVNQKLSASVGKAICLAGQGQPEKGLEILTEIIAKHDPDQKPAVFAQAYNAQGRCFLALKRPKDALLSFLHVDLFPKLHGADPAAHAEALYQMSKLYNEVNQPDRAVRFDSLLKSKYAGSVWARK